MYSGTSLIRMPLGQKKVFRLVRCPDFRGSNMAFGTAKSVEVSSFQGVLIRGVLSG